MKRSMAIFKFKLKDLCKETRPAGSAHGRGLWKNRLLVKISASNFAVFSTVILSIHREIALGYSSQPAD